MTFFKNVIEIPRWALAALAMVLLVAAAACGSSENTAVPATAIPTTAAPDSGSSSSSGGDTIKVGVLHSLSGTMAISETAVRDATLLAIEEINAAGGVLGKQIEFIVEDGASDWPTFAETW